MTTTDPVSTVTASPTAFRVEAHETVEYRLTTATGIFDPRVVQVVPLRGGLTLGRRHTEVTPQ